MSLQSRQPVEAGRETFAETRARLSTAQKSVASVPAYLRFINRPAGGNLAVAAYQLGWTPTQVTAISALCSFTAIGVLLIASPSVMAALVVSGLLVLGFALDSADGQLARLRGGGSPAGEWLDHVIDCFRSCLLHAAVLVFLYRSGEIEPEILLLVPLGFGAISLTFYFGMMLRDQLRQRWARESAGTSERESVLRSVLLLPMDYGVLCLIFLLIAQPRLFLVAYTLLFACTVVFGSRGLVKAYRGLLDLSRA